MFEPVAGPALNEKGHSAEKETLVVDRVTGHIALNRESTSELAGLDDTDASSPLAHLPFINSTSASAPNRHSPVAHEEVVTVFGIVGIISLVTSKSASDLSHGAARSMSTRRLVSRLPIPEC